MKKLIIITICLLTIGFLSAQERIIFYNGSNAVYNQLIEQVDSVNFQNNISIVHANNGDSDFNFPVIGIDSITFITGELAQDTGTTIYIVYNGNAVTVINPLANSGVTITTDGADVTVNALSGLRDVTYNLSGTTNDGSLTMNSDYRFNLILAGVSITNPTGAAIKVVDDVKVSVTLTNTSSLIDGTTGSNKGAFDSEGQIIFSGTGTLNVTGNVKHGIFSNDYVRVLSGNLHINGAVKDGIHGDYFQLYTGTVTIQNAKTGIDGDEGFIQIEGGTLNITVAASDGKGLTCDSTITINGTPNITLNLTGAQSKGFKAGQSMTFNGGIIDITVAGATVITNNDPSHCSGLKSDNTVYINDGTNLTITATATADGGKCISADGNLYLNGGILNLAVAGAGGIYTNTSNQSDSYTAACVKGDANIEVNGGNITLTCSGLNSRGLSADTALNITGGTIIANLSGNAAKALKADGSILLAGGLIDITASGSTVVTSNDPDYCTGINCGGVIVINEGTDLTITCTSSNAGGKCISADGALTINGGVLHLSTAGTGVSYTNTSNQADYYSSACLKSDGAMALNAGDITCTSTGAGGKGIRCGSTMTIGVANASDSSLILNVTTSGAMLGSSGGGGGFPPGGGSSSVKSSPKGIKSIGAMTINSGIMTVHCTQTTEGGECVETKNALTLNGGILELISQKDDALNAATQLTINGGTTYAQSSGNDGIDCNGPMTITGGLTIAAGASAPEEGFDCDQNTFTITGGIAIGTGGATSTPSSSSTQKSIKYTGSSGNAICIYNASNTAILTMQLPTLSGGGGGFPGGGGSNGLIMLFTDPALTSGSYTLKYGGTITGGTNFHGYYTGASYSGGSTKNFTISNSACTSVQ